MTSLVIDCKKGAKFWCLTYPNNLLAAFGTRVSEITFKTAATVNRTFVFDESSLLQWNATSGRLADKAFGVPVFADRLTVFAPIIAQLHGGFHVAFSLPNLLATGGTNWRF